MEPVLIWELTMVSSEDKTETLENLKEEICCSIAKLSLQARSLIMLLVSKFLMVNQNESGWETKGVSVLQQAAMLRDRWTPSLALHINVQCPCGSCWSPSLPLMLQHKACLFLGPVYVLSLTLNHWSSALPHFSHKYLLLRSAKCLGHLDLRGKFWRSHSFVFQLHF